MSKLIDTYKTLKTSVSDVLLKEKGSKFIGYAFPINEEVEVVEIIETLKKSNKNAHHFCYAFQLGLENTYYRVNDDGEPSNTAGMPIYGQIQSFELTNVLVVVIRYFGGTKLGAGGLISAYKNTAKATLEQASIITKTTVCNYAIVFEYKHINSVMRVIKENQFTIINQQMHLKCNITLAVALSQEQNLKAVFEPLYEVEVKKL